SDRVAWKDAARDGRGAHPPGEPDVRRSTALGEDGERGVAARDPRDGAAAPRSRAADVHVRDVGLGPPPADLVVVLGVRPGEVLVEDVAAGQLQRVLEVE